MSLTPEDESQQLDGIDTLAQMAEQQSNSELQIEELEPFSPPTDFDHGEEFEPPVPRPIPKYLRQGSFAKRGRGVIYSLIAIGIMFIVFRPIPFVQGLSAYILPLQYLHWIGLGLIAIGLWKFVTSVITSGRYQYVKDGTPFVGRVIACQKVDCGTTDVPAFRHVASVEFHHPETGEHLTQDIAEPDTWSMAKVHQMSCDLQRGDYVSLVSIPGKGETHHAVYGFLGLDPEREFILKNGRPMQGTSPFTAIMISFLIGFIVLMLMATFDVVMFSFPISGDWKLPVGLAIAGFVIGGMMGVLGSRQSKGKSQQESKFATFFGIGFLGALAAPLGLLILNSRLDQRPTQLEPVEVVEFWHTTTNFVIRNYELEYRELHSRETQKRHLRFSQTTRLYGSRYAAAEISPGRFGYPWVKGIHPIFWMNEAETSISSPVVEFTFNRPEGKDAASQPVTARMVPAISISEDEFVPLPEELFELELNYIRSQPDVISAEKVAE